MINFVAMFGLTIDKLVSLSNFFSLQLGCFTCAFQVSMLIFFNLRVIFLM
jgi:hypothetical protein